MMELITSVSKPTTEIVFLSVQQSLWHDSVTVVLHRPHKSFFLLP